MPAETISCDYRNLYGGPSIDIARFNFEFAYRSINTDLSFIRNSAADRAASRFDRISPWEKEDFDKQLKAKKQKEENPIKPPEKEIPKSISSLIPKWVNLKNGGINLAKTKDADYSFSIEPGLEFKGKKVNPKIAWKLNIDF